MAGIWTMWRDKRRQIDPPSARALARSFDTEEAAEFGARMKQVEYEVRIELQQQRIAADPQLTWFAAFGAAIAETGVEARGVQGDLTHLQVAGKDQLVIRLRTIHEHLGRYPAVAAAYLVAAKLHGLPVHLPWEGEDDDDDEEDDDA